MTIGTHLVTIAEVDVTCLCEQVTIRHGREDTTQQPEASTATIDLDLTDQVLPAAVEVGAPVTISTTIPGHAASTRFSGRIADVALGWDDAGENTPNAGAGQLAAAGVLADLGRRVVGAEPWPQESDGARVSRVMTLAGISLDPLHSDPGVVQVVPRDVDAQAALGVAQSVAQSASGVVWALRDGRVAYADSEHRRNLTPTLDLDACDVLVTPAWQRSTQGLVNKATIAYGVPPPGGEQPTVGGSSATSIARFGTYDYSLATELAALADAEALVGLLLARNSSPVWILTALPVNVADLDADRTWILLGLEMHDLVRLTGLPTIASAPSSTSLWVEGWTERLAFGEHDFELDVSGYCRTAPAPRWDDVDPASTWDTIPPAGITWDQATCLGPLPNRGRWTDVPASDRWDLLDAAITWDTWNNYLPAST